MKEALIRLGVILSMALVVIWGVEMLDRPVVGGQGGVAQALALKRLQTERDSLAGLLSAKSTKPADKNPPVKNAAPPTVKLPPSSSPGSNATAQGRALASELRNFSEQTRLLGVAVYTRYLKDKVPKASFVTVREQQEIVARIKALREVNVARNDCAAGISKGCQALGTLARDNRLTLAQQQMVFDLIEKS